MPRPPRFTLAALAVALLAAAAEAAPIQYALDAEASALHARTYKAGVASGFAHDHVIVAPVAAGEVTFDPADPGSFTIDVRIDARALEPDPPAVRRIYGLEGEIDADDRAEIGKSMRSADQLAVERYPEIRFRSTKVSAVAPGRYTVEGQLTLRGRTQAVSLPVEVEADAEGFTGRGRLRITHAMFGFEPYSALLGAVKNQEKIDLILRVVARPVTGSGGPAMR